MEEIVRARIAELEKQYKKIEKKIFPINKDTVKNAIEAEKIRYAISQLYICLGSKIKQD